MKRIELERAIQEQADKIVKSQIIPKCREIAQQLGKGGKTSQEWANSRYIFDDGSLKLDYETFAMGDEELRAHFLGKKVFEVDEKVNDRAKYPNPEIDVDRKRFEVLLYKSGIWEKRIEIIYRKMTADVPDNELFDAHERLGISLSR